MAGVPRVRGRHEARSIPPSLGEMGENEARLRSILWEKCGRMRPVFKPFFGRNERKGP